MSIPIINPSNNHELGPFFRNDFILTHADHGSQPKSKEQQVHLCVDQKKNKKSNEIKGKKIKGRSFNFTETKTENKTTKYLLKEKQKKMFQETFSEFGKQFMNQKVSKKYQIDLKKICHNQQTEKKQPNIKKTSIGRVNRQILKTLKSQHKENQKKDTDLDSTKYRRKTCKMFQIIEEKNLETTPSSALIGNIEANRYQQVSEYHFYPDGRREKMFKIFQSNKKLEQGSDEKKNIIPHQKEDTEQELNKPKLKQKTSIAQKSKISRFSEPASKKNLQNSQKQIDSKKQVERPESARLQFSQDRRQPNLTQQIREVANTYRGVGKFTRYMSARKSTNYMKLSNLSKKIDLVNIFHEFGLNKSYEPNIKKNNDKKKYYKWENWQINHKNRPQQELIMYEINKKIVEKEEQFDIECRKKIEKQYQELHRLLNLNSQVRKRNKNQHIINKLKEDNSRRVDDFFRKVQEEISLLNQSAQVLQSIAF